MNYTRMGRTGLFVSKICLGCANFGMGTSRGYHDWGVVAEQEAFKIMDYALDVGINFFDTSNVYGPLDHRGMSEEIIGRWFKTGGNRREKTVLGTKVGRIYEMDQVDGPNNRIGYSIYKIRRHLEASLRRLQTDHVELYQMHQRDNETGWDEIWEAFESAVRAGKVDYIGSSQHNAWQIMKGQMAAKQRGFMGLVNEQHLYTPFNRLAEHELLPMALDQGIGITIYSPLFRGVLGMDALNPNKRKSQNAEKKHNFEYLHDTVLAYSKLCREIGESPANVTLAWELRQPAITSVIIAPNSIDDLKELLHCVDIRLDESTLKRMDEIFPPLMEQNPYPDMPNPTAVT
ncbi:MAG: aldo/keto reductase [Treponema sp.]|nr:aldo/keto reductase [Treponema sp.]